ncbi:MAG: hypothetical protein ACAF41_06780 [Leptolyngbya sp. BL-A-14]
MAKPARFAHASSTHKDSLIRSFMFLGATLVAVALVLTLIRQMLPLLQLLAPVVTGWWLWQRHRKVHLRQQKHLHTVFYHLLQAHGGRMTLLDFAMTAAIPAIAARRYLDSRAKEFAARFEVTEQGDVVYVFSSLQLSRSPLPSTSAIEPTVEDSTPTSMQPEPEAVPSSLTQTELANRLGVTATTISRKKYSPLFMNWTQARDPKGIGWSYAAEAQRFSPVNDRLPAQPESEDGD